MVDTQYRCQNEQRRIAIRTAQDENGAPLLNGIDYLEVDSDRKTLFVNLIHPYVGKGLDADNLRIEGKSPVAVEVESVSFFSNLLTVRVNQPGDFSTYTLRLVESPLSPKPAEGFDSQLAQVDFSFQVAFLSTFDCKTPPEPAEKPLPPPAIDYLAKDYASFRQLMLDRLAVTVPKWQERNPSDLGVALVELVAYAADYLSYYQDAVATEAYLGTARKRVSVRRHARLLNYAMHDGCNARAWVALQVNPAENREFVLPGPSVSDRTPGTRFLTEVSTLPRVLKSDKEFEAAINANAQVFETLHDLTVHKSTNTIYFYTWGDEQCQLPAGATRATLLAEDDSLHKLLIPGRVLLFEEVKSPQSGICADADPAHRHVVRITKADANYDVLFDKSVIDVEWSIEDALPFPFSISAVVNDQKINNISVVRGNLLLVDHGRTLAPEILDENLSRHRYHPRLKNGPLTQQGSVRDRQGKRQPFDPQAAAIAAQKWNIQNVKPEIVLKEGNTATYWQPQRDLLNSDRFAREFVVETEDDGRAFIRFGDNILGKCPDSDTPLTAIYRIGNGKIGNIGADAIAHIFLPDLYFQSLISDSTSEVADCSDCPPIRNPLPATGGVDPELIEQVRLYAPQAFKVQQRAVTESDYAEVAQRFPTVRKALATRRWTGSWYTIVITVDREGGLDINALFEQGVPFKQSLQKFLEQFRLTGHDLEIEAPRFVPLDILLKVQVVPNYFSSEVKKVLLEEAFSNRVLSNGQLGFFHPDNLTFGQPVYLSQVVTTAMGVAGVQSIDIGWDKTKFQRLGLPPQRELETGRISLERLEIAQLDNNPNTPERGRIDFVMEGGL